MRRTRARRGPIRRQYRLLKARTDRPVTSAQGGVAGTPRRGSRSGGGEPTPAACRAREKMPRPRPSPPARQSIQAAVYSHSASDSAARAKNSSSEPKRMSSASRAIPSTRRRRSVARSTTPVRPSPPIVAANIGPFSVGEQFMRVPSLRASSKDSRWRPKVPARWWFLPCTSLAMAPPTVTKRVPGVTGRNHPLPSASGRQATAKMSASCTPASQVRMPVSRSKETKRSRPRQSSSRPPGLSATSP